MRLSNGGLVILSMALSDLDVASAI